jgi:tRNA U34 5-carboxymethylaminomethyl modifying GTPase MnmE/TrmE
MPGWVTPELILTVLVAMGLFSGAGYGLKALLERRALRSKAGSDDATAAAVVSAAARELIDPLRKELAQERADHIEEMAQERHEHAQAMAIERRRHAEDIEEERRKVEFVRDELDAALRDLGLLREELTKALQQAEAYRAELRESEDKNRALARSLARKVATENGTE